MASKYLVSAFSQKVVFEKVQYKRNLIIIHGNLATSHIANILLIQPPFNFEFENPKSQNIKRFE